MSMDADSNSNIPFLWLVSCAYYKQHVSAFQSQTPEALFSVWPMLLPNMTNMQNGYHKSELQYDNGWKWSQKQCHQCHLQRLHFYTGRDADGCWLCGIVQLRLHWSARFVINTNWYTYMYKHKYMFMYIRTCRISIYWLHNIISFFIALTQYGWKRQNGKLPIKREAPQNISRSKASIDFFLSGCKCKTGDRKEEKNCGPSCSCHFCINSPQS